MDLQACGRNALVDLLGRYRCLDQCFVLAAGPFPTHALFDGEQARRVVQFLADVFTDALKLAAASKLSVIRLVWITYAGTTARAAHAWVSDAARPVQLED